MTHKTASSSSRRCLCKLLSNKPWNDCSSKIALAVRKVKELSISLCILD
jgi:hypothetical protein